MVQLVPPLVVYSQVVSASRPVTLMVPTLVMPSALLLPLSVTNTKPRAEGLVVSILGRFSSEVLVLPAGSVKEAVTVMDSVPANLPALAV